jgi:23S rRNA (adenine2503-C2)-methyltransferase
VEPLTSGSRTPLFGLTPAEFCRAVEALGLTAAEGRRVYAQHAKWGDRGWAIPHLARTKAALLESKFVVPTLEVIERRPSPTDGFLKYLFRLEDGEVVEAVRIPLFEDKYTVCISSQAGCALGCVFCATGRRGFRRNLSSWEIVEQVRTIRREADRPVRGVVFMGMGEPLLNYDEVVRAARILSDPVGLAISGEAITISTAGVVPAIRRFTADRLPFRLAVSLTAGTATKRKTLMPVENTWPIEALVEAIRDHGEVTGQRVMIEYVAIAGVNCGVDDAAALANLLRGIRIRFNLIEVNDATGAYLPPSAEEFKAFRDALQILGQPIVRRYSGGKDVQAGCGMLAGLAEGEVAPVERGASVA